ncbi:MAG: hypothetical protein WKF94_01395 [Solirubrobacteraceae bacterium]
MPIRRIRVQIETARLQITGVLQLPTEGYRSRVTDYLNGHDTGFFALTEAEMTPLDGSPSELRDYVAIGARHIVALAELEDLGVLDEDLGAPSLADYSSPSTPPPAP